MSHIHIVIKIETDNAAFADGNREREAERILRDIRWHELLRDGGSARVRDINGNKVGEVEVTEAD